MNIYVSYVIVNSFVYGNPVPTRPEGKKALKLLAISFS